MGMIKVVVEGVKLVIVEEGRKEVDMGWKDVVKEGVKELDGRVMVVCEEGELVEGVVRKVYEFGGGVVKEDMGGM